jgi:predicted Zn-dependent peptidase
MCKDEAYGLNEFGNIEEVSKISEDSLYKSYQNLINNSEIFVFCEGDFDTKKLTELFKNNFASDTKSDMQTKIIPRASVAKEITEILEVNQGKLTLGFRMDLPLNEEQNIKIALFNEIFGGSPNSKLFENVRERLSLCYYCASRIERHKRIMIVYSGVENANMDLAKNEILHQLEEIKKGNITDFEMDAAKKSLYNKYISSEDSVMQTEDWYLGQYLSNGSISTLDAAKTLENINIDDIINVANSLSLDTVYFLKGNEAKNDEKNN